MPPANLPESEHCMIREHPNDPLHGITLEDLGKRIKWLILPLHESETDRHLIGLSG
jgi:hypothetical protein